MSEADLAPRLRRLLEETARHGRTLTYQETARALELAPPQTIHRVATALERLIEEDAAAGRPLLAALVVSRTGSGLPAPGFFDCAERCGRFAGDAAGPEAAAFHARELEAVLALHGGVGSDG